MPLDILEEVKTMYPREFLIAKEGLDLIEKETRTTLSEDEAGYIVLHYINAQGQHFRSDAKIRLLFQEHVIQKIEQVYDVKLDHLSVYYSRFLTHLQAFWLPACTTDSYWKLPRALCTRCLCRNIRA